MPCGSVSSAIDAEFSELRGVILISQIIPPLSCTYRHLYLKAKVAWAPLEKSRSQAQGTVSTNRLRHCSEPERPFMSSAFLRGRLSPLLLRSTGAYKFAYAVRSHSPHQRTVLKADSSRRFPFAGTTECHLYCEAQLEN
jgi:hypothetical protein